MLVSVLKKAKPRARSSKDSHRLLVVISRADWQRIERFRKDFYELTRTRVTAAFLMREGSKRLIAKLRSDMRKAKAGVLHAKPRAEQDFAPIMRLFQAAPTKAHETKVPKSKQIVRIGRSET